MVVIIICLITPFKLQKTCYKIKLRLQVTDTFIHLRTPLEKISDCWENFYVLGYSWNTRLVFYSWNASGRLITASRALVPPFLLTASIVKSCPAFPNFSFMHSETGSWCRVVFSDLASCEDFICSTNAAAWTEFSMTFQVWLSKVTEITPATRRQLLPQHHVREMFLWLDTHKGQIRTCSCRIAKGYLSVSLLLKQFLKNPQVKRWGRENSK